MTGLGRAALFDVGDATVPAEDTPALQSLLPMWDGALMAHTGAGRVVPEGYRPLVARHNGDMLPCLLVDGQVVGVWRAADGGLELTVFHKLGKVAWQGLTGEAERLSTPARRPRSSRLPVLRTLVEQGVSRYREHNRQGLTTPSGSAPRLSACSLSSAVCDWAGRAHERVKLFDDRAELAGTALRHCLQHAAEEGTAFERVAAAVPVHIAELIVVPELALRAMDVVLPHAQCRADVPWLEVVSRAFDANDLGQRSRGEAVDGQSCVL
ncbi:DNA glycosylase AlkZ-like family protein [Streptomyces mirabilis]|uniref:DNA glycosylase AlkZ-like family protein n=1 Tax=Streptomyces mirabilis TaxID=68239 RepID=UPI0033B26F2C